MDVVHRHARLLDRAARARPPGHAAPDHDQPGGVLPARVEGAAAMGGGGGARCCSSAGSSTC
jgi:hypothetical protein